jgi:hypothetical protein
MPAIICRIGNTKINISLSYEMLEKLYSLNSQSINQEAVLDIASAISHNRFVK